MFPYIHFLLFLMLTLNIHIHYLEKKLRRNNKKFPSFFFSFCYRLFNKTNTIAKRFHDRLQYNLLILFV